MNSSGFAGSHPNNDLDKQEYSYELLILYLAKAIRTFGFGGLSVVFAIFLSSLHFTSLQIGALISATLIEDALLTGAASMIASRFGLKPILLVASFLIALSGALLACNTNPWIVAAIAIFGIISPAGFEGGPFGALEQTYIAKFVSADRLTKAYSTYNLTGFAGAAFGALLSGLTFNFLSKTHPGAAYQVIFLAYCAGGITLMALYGSLKKEGINFSPNQSRSDLSRTALSILGNPNDSAKEQNTKPKLPRIMWTFGALQGLDAFGGGFVPQTLISYWFYERFAAGPEFTGPVFFLTYLFAALSLFISPWICKRFGLLNTMVFTHLPCSITLCLMPFMPSAFLAGLLLVSRSLFSSMDIPARQAYSMLVVDEQNRAGVAGLSAAARSTGQCAAPLVSGLVLANTFSGLPFFCAGACKTIYDIVLLVAFKDVPLITKDQELILPEKPEPDHHAAAHQSLHITDRSSVRR